MAQVSLDVSIESLPDLLRQAVRSVPRAALIEVSAEGALVGRRTNFATRAETTRFTFQARPDGGCEVRAVSTNLLVYGGLTLGADDLLDTGRAVLAALQSAARQP